MAGGGGKLARGTPEVCVQSKSEQNNTITILAATIFDEWSFFVCNKFDSISQL